MVNHGGFKVTVVPFGGRTELEYVSFTVPTFCTVL